MRYSGLSRVPQELNKLQQARFGGVSLVKFSQILVIFLLIVFKCFEAGFKSVLAGTLHQSRSNHFIGEQTLLQKLQMSGPLQRRRGEPSQSSGSVRFVLRLLASISLPSIGSLQYLDRPGGNDVLSIQVYEGDAPTCPIQDIFFCFEMLLLTGTAGTEEIWLAAWDANLWCRISSTSNVG